MDKRSLTNLIIPGWVIFELQLKHSELRVYCVILGYSQYGQGEYFGSLQYLADWCGISSRCNVHRVLRSLEQKGLIRKITQKEINEKGKIQTVVHYRAIVPSLNGNGTEE